MRKRKPGRGLVELLTCILIMTAGFSQICSGQEASMKTVRVAYVLAPGYQEGGEGEYKTGYGYEYLQKLAGINGWKYEYVYGSFSELLKKLQSGEVDLMGNLSYTDERAETILYGTYEQGKENYFLYGNVNHNVIDALDYTTINGKKIGVNAGSNQEKLWKEWCEARQISCEIIEFEKSADRQAALNSGTIDATIGGTIQQDEVTADWQVLLNFASSPFYFGVSKAREDLLEELNQAQKQILEENPFYNEEVHDRYMKMSALTTTKLDNTEKTWLESREGRITVGYLKNFQPLSYQNDAGTFCGIAADLFRGIEQQYAAEEIQFEAVPFQNYETMLAALQDDTILAAWPVFADYWNADQKRFLLTDDVMTGSMTLVFDGEYSPRTIETIGINASGSLSEPYSVINFPQSRIVKYNSYEEAMAALAKREVNSVLYETSIYQVNEVKDESLHSYNTVSLSQSIDLAIAVSFSQKPLVSILNKGIASFGDAGVNRALLTNSSLEKEITLKAYFDQHPRVVNVLLGGGILLAAGIILFAVYKNMSVRVRTSQAEKEVFEHLSNTDPLTGLYNRKAVFRRSTELLNEHPKDKFVMAHIDMKHFRLYNTFFGEKTGDQLLCDIADLLRKLSAEYEYCAYGRIEADVFCMFFPYNREKYQKHVTSALDYLKSYRSDFLIEPVIGLYFVTDPKMPAEAMFSRATLAAKEVQTATPYATVVYGDRLEQELNEKQQIINEMQSALEQEQFAVYLQPKYSLRNNSIVGAEALVRWIHPVKGVISPGSFIPVFESNGFITELDRYMWEHVCRILSEWKKDGKPMLPISVNVSRLSMYGTATVDFLKALVRKYDVDPSDLELELTESAYMDQPEEMKAQMTALREAGFKILLDDFGSGFSSLNTLRELPVDVLKLDMKFLSQQQRDTRGELVISSVVRMTKLLKLPVIAEGVERQEQADYLKSIGCEYVQGYLFSYPVTVAEYEKLPAFTADGVEHTELTMADHIGRIIAETENTTYELGMIIPTPLACLEYSDQRFIFLRANPAFYTEFDLVKDPAPASEIFKTHLSEKSYSDFTGALEESMQTGEQVQIRINWQEENGVRRVYLCRVAYEGNIGKTAVFITLFSEITGLAGCETEKM